MKRKTAAIVAIAITAASLAATSPATAAPTNDDYADATVIDSLPFTDVRDIAGATHEAPESMPSCSAGSVPRIPAAASGYGSVWYRYEPSTDTAITIDPTASDFNFIVGVYEGPDLLTHHEIGCARAFDGALTIDLAEGRSYAIQVMTPGDRTMLTLAVVEGRNVPLPPDPAFREDAAPDPATGDATVIAVIDSGISPYHWDFLASRMPQALDANPANDLPLDRPPHTWLPGFPDPDTAFASYNRLDLTLEEDDPSPTYGDLREADAAEWNAVRPSATDDVNYYWVPGTKVIGAATFAPQGRIEPPAGIRHGHMVSSSAVGNYVGTCPECLLVFVQIEPAETMEQSNRQVVAAFEWALEQPWIDVVSSSQSLYQDAPVSPDGAPFPPMNFFESTFDTALQRSAAERGQTLFQSGGNGFFFTFSAPNPTLTNSMKGPDWVVTVGGISSTGSHLSGTGKPVDVAAPALNYPVSFPDDGVGARRTAAGTSFAAPAVAGTYAQALHHARRSLPGASRAQRDGVVATTDGSFACDAARPDCEMSDAVLTADELRTRLLHAAIPTPNATTRTGLIPIEVDDAAPIAREWQLMNQGHGAYFGRVLPDDEWLEEADRVIAPVVGRSPALDRPDGEREWMIVDSYCRQEIWGSWDGGYFVEGETQLPGADPEWPSRSIIEASCPHLPLPAP